MPQDDFPAQIAAANRLATRAMEHLLGMVTGIVADDSLHDREVQLLSTWLRENVEITQSWPAFVIARKVEDVLADGVITEAERDHLLGSLKLLVSTDFSLTGSSTPEVAALPVNDAVTVLIKNATVCHTGEFMFGTRASCERVTLKAGGMPVDAVTRRTDYLVVGTRVSPSWAHTNYGRKIQRAAELQAGGHSIEIISERRWIEAVSS